MPLAVARQSVHTGPGHPRKGSSAVRCGDRPDDKGWVSRERDTRCGGNRHGAGCEPGASKAENETLSPVDSDTGWVPSNGGIAVSVVKAVGAANGVSQPCAQHANRVWGGRLVQG